VGGTGALSLERVRLGLYRKACRQSASARDCERRRENGLILPVSKWTVFVSSLGQHGIRSTPAKIRGQCLKAMLVVITLRSFARTLSSRVQERARRFFPNYFARQLQRPGSDPSPGTDSFDRQNGRQKSIFTPAESDRFQIGTRNGPLSWHESSFHRSSMQKHLSVMTQAAGVVHINRKTGLLFWEREDLDPVLKQYTKNYLWEEGFIELALGILDPRPNESSDLFLDDVLN
jgi:hypothetical protein